ncbi:transmembrane alpha-helix domain-containing protein [Purpureocillium lavendulum]|uniref:Transmembrane alpha-helix domain-containing protein n=1 Tax=Purpureocillium lavendulum TaxID=1247861 RepID=A0AB34FN14_9HYPO|nr:transmembrane alpha-helix domain-containing protein [Purpureocillium lavendulum]
MPPTAKSADARRKSGGKAGLLITLTVPSRRLQEIVDPDSIKEDTPSAKSPSEPKDVKESPSNSASVAAAPTANGENATDSNAATPAAEGTPAPSVMGPPADGPKKRGTKRGAAGLIDGIPKPRGKPGPKKKPRLEDGTIDHSAARPSGAHKLGPKANQGAINAGLRALDRSGKPCRKWARGGFTLKSFTGVVWEVSRWTAPPKKATESSNGESAAPSADNSSSKENKENGQEGNSNNNSNSGADPDAEMRSVHSVNASSPAPIAVTAAS